MDSRNFSFALLTADMRRTNFASRSPADPVPSLVVAMSVRDGDGRVEGTRRDDAFGDAVSVISVLVVFIAVEVATAAAVSLLSMVAHVLASLPLDSVAVPVSGNSCCCCCCAMAQLWRLVPRRICTVGGTAVSGSSSNDNGSPFSSVALGADNWEDGDCPSASSVSRSSRKEAPKAFIKEPRRSSSCGIRSCGRGPAVGCGMLAKSIPAAVGEQGRAWGR